MSVSLRIFLFAASLFAASVLSAAEFATFAPEAQEAAVSQPVGAREVTISFALSAPAIVTVDILTNATGAADGWASVGLANLSTLSGPANRLVSETGRQSLTWTPGNEPWAGLTREQVERTRFQAGRLRAVVTAWSPKCPPEFMVINLEDTSEVRYYAAAAAVADSVPGTLTNDIYRTTRLVMRRCDAGRFHQGASTEPACWNMSKKPGHTAILTRDFYIGVFEFTQGQYKTLTGQEWNCWFGKAKRPDDYLKLPIDGGTSSSDSGSGLTYGKLRGTSFTAGVVADGTMLATLRAKLGLAVDLPTVAQWERAYRAGAQDYSSYPDGLGAYASNSAAETLARAARFCWYTENSAIDGEKQTHVVGTREPNPWGIYDMGGNVFEYCRDPLPAYDGSTAIGSADSELAWYAELAADPEKAVDPDSTTASTASGQVAIRGGCYSSIATFVTAFAHEAIGGTGWSSCKQGFRLCYELAFDEADNIQ